MGYGTPARAPAPSGEQLSRRRQSRNRSAVPLQHLHVGQEVVGKEDRLGPLEVGVPGHDGPGVAAGQLDEGGLEVGQLPVQPVQLLPQPEAQVEGDLIVPAPGGVELLAHLPHQLHQPALHGHVDVLVLRTGREAPLGELGLHLVQALEDGGRLRFRQNPLAGQHPRHGPGSPRYPRRKRRRSKGKEFWNAATIASKGSWNRPDLACIAILLLSTRPVPDAPRGLTRPRRQARPARRPRLTPAPRLSPGGGRQSPGAGRRAG